MKRFLFTMVMLCVGVLQMLAQDKKFDYTDENGVTWSCSFSKSYYDYNKGGYVKLALINSASNYGETVVVPGTVYDEDKNEYTVTGIESLFKGDKTITKVTLPKGITSLNETFNGCSNLAAVENTDKIETLDYYAFQDCKSLTSIDLSSCKTISSNSFSGCSNLKEVKLGKCENIYSSAFSDCNNLQSIDVSTVKYIGYQAFYNCSSIVNVDLKNCSSIDKYAFYGCTSLAKVENASLLTSISESAFSGCIRLTTIDLSNCTTIASMAFSGCSSLQNVDLSRCKSYGSSAFSGCASITTVDLTACKGMEACVFSDCSSLKEIIGLEKFTKIESGTFSGCNLSTVKLPLCKSIGDNAFSKCMSLSSVELPNCSQVGNRAFSNCTSLSSAELPNCLKIGFNVFSNCTSLSSVELPNCSQLGIYAFSNCTSLNSVELPNCSEIEIGVFQNCTSLSSVELPNCETVSVSSFMNCSNLETVKLPKCEKICDGYYDRVYSKRIYYGAFANCIKLQSVEIPNCKSLGCYAFYGCNFKEFALPATLQSIGRSCFDNDVVLTMNAETPPTVTGTEKDNGTLLGDFAVLKVPEASLASYKTADVWKDYANRILSIGAVLDYDVKTTAQQSTSGLAEAVGKDKLSSVVTLKVSGTINGYDIMVMRNKMDNLHHLDLSDADIVANSYEYYTGCCSQDSVVGRNAFRELNKLVTVKLPNSAKSIGSDAFNGCI